MPKMFWLVRVGTFFQNIVYIFHLKSIYKCNIKIILNMEQKVLNGVGKKTRQAYLRGEMSAKQLERLYLHNKAEADAFTAYGLKASDLRVYLRKCHNPILKMKLEECIKSFDEKSRKSNEQNKLSIEKLNDFLANAMGVGLKRIIRIMKNEARKSHDMNLKAITALLETEFANLSAKTHGKQLKSVIYERKSILLNKVSTLLEGSDWKFGYNDNCGKNASYIIYVYLPDGTQLSWHTNDYDVYQRFPYIDVQWDGRVCATMDKLLTYIQKHYMSLFFPSSNVAA